MPHTYGTNTYSGLFNNERLRKVFAGVDLAATRRENERRLGVGRTDLLEEPGPFALPLYPAVMDRKEPLTRRHFLRDLRMKAQAAMFRALCELHPDEGFGDNLLIDGSLFPAWCKQVGKGATDEQELLRRCKTPHAGSRTIQYTASGKLALDDGDVLSGRAVSVLSSAKHARGYYYVCIVDQASGWPLVSMLVDASFDEAEALIPLLSDLYRYYGDFITPKHIAGDGAWDEAWAHRLCELFYGLAPVFRATNRSQPHSGIMDMAANQSRSVNGYTKEGRLRCLDHNRLLPMSGFDAPALGPLRFGQGAGGHPDSAAFRRALEQREEAFRLRALDDHGAGPAVRLSAPVHVDWRRLNRIPRHPYGKPALYAFRLALQMRLKNQMEGHFARMQAACKLGTDGSDRLRVRDWETVEGFLGLAELRMCALSLADVRIQAGSPAPSLPDAPVAPPPVEGDGGHRAAACRMGVAAGTATATAGAACAAPATARAHTPLPPAAVYPPLPAEAPATSAPPPPVAVPAATLDPAPTPGAASDGPPGWVPGTEREPGNEVVSSGPAEPSSFEVVGVEPAPDPVVSMAVAVGNGENLGALPDNVIAVDFKTRRRQT